MCLRGRERAPKACYFLECLVVVEMMWLAAGIWAYLGWKETLEGLIINSLSLTKPVSKCVCGLLCE